LPAKSGRVVVLGAGLQGLCVAMALAERGAEVTVIERRPGPMREASFRSADRIADGTLAALVEYFPALDGAEVLSCDSGVIVARATCDVHDPASGLHSRSESGIRGGDGWWSIDTGKLTLAPLRGERAARQICEELGLAWRAPRGA